MKQFILLLAFISTASCLSAQDIFFTKTGKIGFDATTSSSPEKIAGTNKSVTCVVDTKKGDIQFSMLMKGFEFERALMQEHFNENYVETGKFPKAEFKGQIANNSQVNYAKDGTYSVKVKGNLTIHGETKSAETDGKLVIAGGKITASADFNVLLSDYKVAIPSLVSDKVAKTAKISVDCLLEPLKKN